MGGPTVKRVAAELRGVILCAGVALAVCASATASGAPAAAEQPVRLRITWGGGKPAARMGQIELVDPGTPPQAVEWRLLSADPLALATMHQAGGTIEIHEPDGLDTNGVEIAVVDWRRARLRVRLARRDTGEQPVVYDGPVANLLTMPSQQSLDTDGNRLSIGRAPGDELRVAFAPGESAIRRVGEALPLMVYPLVASQATTTAAYELKVRVRRSGATVDTHVEAVPLEDMPSPSGGSLREFRPVQLVLPLPADEGAFDVGLELVERGGLRWSRAAATRTVQVVAIADAPFDPPDVPWNIVYELDPGSPKLLERLRRLPPLRARRRAALAFPRPQDRSPDRRLRAVPRPSTLARLDACRRAGAPPRQCPPARRAPRAPGRPIHAARDVEARDAGAEDGGEGSDLQHGMFPPSRIMAPGRLQAPDGILGKHHAVYRQNGRGWSGGLREQMRDERGDLGGEPLGAGVHGMDLGLVALGPGGQLRQQRDEMA
jgi:hypothetical protein